MTDEQPTQQSLKVSHYVKLFEEIRGQVANDQIALGILQEVSKDSRMPVMEEFRQHRWNGNHAATFKQISFLRSMGFAVSDTIGRKEASDMIEQVTRKKGSGSSRLVMRRSEPQPQYGRQPDTYVPPPRIEMPREIRSGRYYTLDRLA